MSVLKLYNPEAYKHNTLVAHKSKSGCCGEDADFCKYTISGRAISNVRDITLTIDGNPEVVVFDTPLNSAKEIRKAIAKALMDKGYDPYYCDAWKGITVTSDEVSLIGEMEVVSIGIGNSQVNFEKLCNTGRVCKVRGLINYDTDPGLLSVDGETSTQVGTTDGFSAGQSTELMTALSNSVDAVKIEVEEQASYEAYVFTLHLVGNSEVTLDGESLSPCGCYPDFIKDSE